MDANSATAWSSDEGGDYARLEIQCPSGTAVASLGICSRNMGTSAEIISFLVVSDDGSVAGPVVLGGAGQVFYFETEITGKRLGFEALETSGGSTGVVEV